MISIKETNVTIMVSNMDKSVAFYEAIGLKVKNRWANHYAQLVAKDIIIGLHPASGEIKPSANVSIGFITENLEEVKEHLGKEKIAFSLSEDKAGKFAHFTDPDGTTIYFMQPNMSW